MENTFSVKMIFHFYHSVVKAELKRRGFSKEVAKKIEEEHGKIVARAKDIGKSKLLSSYIMASYYIAMNRSTGKSAQENYEIFRDNHTQGHIHHCPAVCPPPSRFHITSCGCLPTISNALASS